MQQAHVERLGHHGDGIAAGPVFVRRALPGEIVEGEVSAGRMDAPRIISPSPNRVSARCRHYKSCGGCALQHASDDFVALWKKEIVERSLSAVGLEAPIRAVHTSPEESRRRATLSGKRTKSGALIGFFAPASDVLTEVPDCRILHPGIRSSLDVLREMTVAGASRKGVLKFAVTETNQGLDVLVTGGRDPEMALRETLARLAQQGDLARLIWNGELIAARRTPMISLGGVDVPIPPGAFLQATKHGEMALQAAVLDAIGTAKGKVLDLFAGCGTFALPFAHHREVHAVEGDAALLAALEGGWRHGIGLKKITTEVRDLFRRPLDADDLSGFVGAVIDPPRAGAEAQSIALARSGLQRVAAVSCNPVTFARDAAILVRGGFELDWIEVVDQFRWSAHVELVAAFHRS